MWVYKSAEFDHLPDFSKYNTMFEFDNGSKYQM